MKRQMETIIRAATCCAFGLMLGPAQAGLPEHTLRWDQVDEPGIVGYRVHYGKGTRDYTEVIDVGARHSYRVTGLDPEAVYYFAITAYDDQGHESDYSIEVTSGTLGKPMGMDGATSTERSVAEVASPAKSTSTGSAAFQDGQRIQAGSLEHTLRWDRIDEPGIAGYRVHYGEGTRDYTEMVDVGLQESYRVTGLDPDVVYYFAITAYDDQGYESDYSREVTSGAFRYLFGMGGTTSTESGWIEVANETLYEEQRIHATSPDHQGPQGEVRIATGDLDGDGRDEVVIGFGPGGTGSTAGWFRVLDDDLSHLAWGQVDWGEYIAINGETHPAVGDLDGDGRAEILIGLGRGGGGMMQVFAYADAGLRPLGWTQVDWPEYNRLLGEARPAIGDIDGDGRAEVVVGLGYLEPGPVSASGVARGGKSLQGGPTTSGGLFYVKHGLEIAGLDDPALQDLLADRLLTEREATVGVLSWSDYAAQIGETWPALGDLTGDGRAEIVLGLGRGGQGLFEVFQYQDQTLVPLATGAVEWPDYQMDNGETRPVVKPAQAEMPAQVLIGLGDSGGGRVEVFETHAGQIELVDGFELWSSQYRAEAGATLPAIKLEKR